MGSLGCPERMHSPGINGEGKLRGNQLTQVPWKDGCLKRNVCVCGSPIILVLLTPCADTQFQGELLQRGAQNTRGGEFCDFRLKSPFISAFILVVMER